MNNYKYFVSKNNLEVKKVTIKENKVIIDTPLDSFIIIKGDINKYNYLLSRGFDYIPKIIDYDNTYIMFKNYNTITYDLEERLLDFVKLLSLLHIKTSYYKEVTNYDYKIIYEKLLNKINDTRNYYLNLINIVESKEYMSPSEYLIARNISNILYLLDYSNDLLEKYYSIVKDNNKIRVVTLFNNDINNMIKTRENIYLFDFINCKVDIPIFDIYNLYCNYFDYIDIKIVLRNYNKIYKLTEEETLLLTILIIIPDKVIINNSVNNIKNIKYSLNKIYKSFDCLKPDKEETGKAKKEEDN